MGRVLYQRALAIYQRTLGPRHPQTLDTLGALGLLLIELGELDAAAEHLKSGLRISTETLGVEHPVRCCQLGSATVRVDFMSEPTPSYRGHRFSAEIISHGVFYESVDPVKVKLRLLSFPWLLDS